LLCVHLMVDLNRWVRNKWVGNSKWFIITIFILGQRIEKGLIVPGLVNNFIMDWTCRCRWWMAVMTFKEYDMVRAVDFMCGTIIAPV
jgi:hypothetical protein